MTSLRLIRPRWVNSVFRANKQILALRPLMHIATPTSKSLLMPTSGPALTLNRGKKGKGKGKDKLTSKELDDLLDDLDLDDDLEEVKVTNKGIHNSQVAKFMVERERKHVAKKHKMKGEKVHHVQHASYEEVTSVAEVDLYWKTMDDIVNDLKHHYQHHLTLRSVTAFDEIKVELEGDEYPLNEIAKISKKDPKRIVIDTSSFPQATSNIMNVLRDSTMNLNPQQDGTRIYVPIPKVTKEYRENMAHAARAKCNESKDQLREVMTKFTRDLGDLELKGEHLSKDLLRSTRELLQDILDHFVKESDEILVKKQKEISGK